MKRIKYKLVITPAIPPMDRHRLEDVIEELGYKTTGGGTWTDLSKCDITFEKQEG